jgi:MFS family permease
MYQVESSSQAIKARGGGLFRRVTVSGSVLGLAWTSFFTDISAEMVASVLPVYLFFSLQLSPLQLGLLDGLQQGASAFVRLIGGYLADRWTRYKQVALAGYALSAIVKVGYLVAGAGWGWIASLIVADRVGKGIRTAPRDALISLSSRREEVGTSFGVHRAFDTAGAMLGPVFAFGVLALVPGQFDAVFVVSLSFALVGISVLCLFVPSDRPSASEGSGVAGNRPVSLAAAAGLLHGRNFRNLTLAAVLLGFATISDAFLYLSIQQRLHFNVGLFPLLFVATSAAYMVFAIPMGRFSDRFGRARTLLGGYLLLLLVYTILLHDQIGWPIVLLYLALHGGYYAATDGVLMALASQGLPPELRGSGLALVGTAVGLARLLSSVLFGALWMVFGLEPTVTVFFALLVAALFLSAFLILAQDSHVVSG